MTRLRLYFLFALVLTAALLLLGSIPYFNIQIGCGNANQYQEKYCVPFYVTRLFFGATAEFIHEYRDEILAGATALIAIFTFTLWRATSKLWKLNIEQIKLARDEFIATHRPRIGVRGFRWGTAEQRLDAVVGVSFIFTNSGESDARIIEIGSNIIFSAKDARGEKNCRVKSFSILTDQAIWFPREEMELALPTLNLSGMAIRCRWQKVSAAIFIASATLCIPTIAGTHAKLVFAAGSIC